MAGSTSNGTTTGDGAVRTMLERSLERFRAVTDSLDALVYVSDMRTYEVLYVNRHGRRVFGDVEGRRCYEYLQQGQTGPCAFCTNDRLLDAEGQPGEPYVWEFQNTRTGLWYECRDVAIRWPDREYDVRLEMATDITARRTMESQLVEAKEAAEAANRAKTRLLARISHDFRTPLNSIIGFSGTLLMGLAGELAEEQERQVGMIQRSGRHLLVLVNELLDLSRIESGHLVITTSEFDLAELVRSTVDIVRVSAEEQGLELEVVSADDEVEVCLDADRVRQVLFNLLSNAVKYTSEGQVTVALDASESRVTITVTDTGPGIADAEIPEFFQEFVRGDAAETRTPGSGLGLAIAARLATAMGGTVAVTSVVGTGSTFTVDLPRKV